MTSSGLEGLSPSLTPAQSAGFVLVLLGGRFPDFHDWQTNETMRAIAPEISPQNPDIAVTTLRGLSTVLATREKVLQGVLAELTALKKAHRMLDFGLAVSDTVPDDDREARRTFLREMCLREEAALETVTPVTEAELVAGTVGDSGGYKQKVARIVQRLRLRPRGTSVIL